MTTKEQDVPRSSQQKLTQAIGAADVGVILTLLDDANLDLDHRDVGHDLQTPLMQMCHMRAGYRQLEGLAEKLECCAWNPNVQDVTGRTLLMHACIATRLPVVLLCLDNGCDVSLADRDGNSALVYAVRSGSDDIVRVILEVEECRPFLEKRNNIGQTPLDIAIQDGLDTIATHLSSHLPSLPHPNHPKHHHRHHHHPHPPPAPSSSHTSSTNTTTTNTTTLPKATLSPGTTLAPPSPMSPRSPVGSRISEENGLYRTSSDTGHGLLALQNLWGPGGPSRHGGKGGDRESELQTPSCRLEDLPSNGPSRMSSLTSLQLHSRHEHHSLTSRETTYCSEIIHPESRAMTSREPTSYSEVGEKSPRRAQRNKKQRLLRRQTDEQLAENAEGVLDTPRGKPRANDLSSPRKDYVSLPDLRDFKGKLVTSGEATPVSLENTSPLQSQNSSGRRGEGSYEEDNEVPAKSYLERYKNADLSASCSLPPLQSSSADVGERRKERGGKLMHRGKASSTDEVMLRSLIV